jgi:hypothetical protein
MTRYKLPDRTTTALSLGGREYKAKDGMVEVPDAHARAHRAALALGLAPVVAPAKAK